MNQCQKIIALLGDGKWHSTIELQKICWRYGARMSDLRERGYVFEKQKHPNLKKIELWKLIEAPRVEIAPVSQKLVKVSLF